MKILLLINFLIEGLVGLVFIIAPEYVPIFANPAPDARLLYMVRMYGFAALAIAAFSAMVYTKIHEQELLITGLFTLFLFHTFIGIAQVITVVDNSTTLPAAILHATLALGFFVVYLREA